MAGATPNEKPSRTDVGLLPGYQDTHTHTGTHTQAQTFKHTHTHTVSVTVLQ